MDLINLEKPGLYLTPKKGPYLCKTGNRLLEPIKSYSTLNSAKDVVVKFNPVRRH